MKFNHVGVTGRLVQPVYILSDNGFQLAHFFQFGQSPVGIVGIGSVYDFLHLRDQNCPNPGRITHQGIDMGDFHGIDTFPEPPLSAKWRNSAFGRNPGTGQRRHVIGGSQIFSSMFDQIIHIYLIQVKGSSGIKARW